MKLRFRMAALLLALILLAGVLVSCASTDDPLNILKEALERTVMERFGGDYLATFIESLNGGVIDLRFGGAAPALLDLPVDAAELRLWMNMKEQTAVADGLLTVAGVDYDGTLFLDRDRLVLTSDALLGSTDLGIDFGTLSADLNHSIFRNNSGSEFMIPWLGSTAADDISTLQEGLFTVWESLEDWYVMSDELVELFLECLVANMSNHCYTKDGNIYIGDSAQPISITNNVLSRTLRDLHGIIVEDGEFCAEIRRIAATRDAMLSARAGNGTKITEWTVCAESFLKSKQIVNEWCDYIDNKLPDFRLDLIAVVDGIIEQATVKLSVAPEKGQAAVHRLTLGLDLTDDDTNVITLERDGVRRTLTYQVEEDGFSEYKAKLRYQITEVATGKSLQLVTGELNADRGSDFYELILVRDGVETRRFTGSFDKKIDGFSVSVDGASINGEPHKLSLSLTVDVDADPVDLPEDYKKLFNLSHAEYAPIHGRMTAALDTLKSRLGEIPQTPTAWLKRLLNVIGADEPFPSNEP